MQLEDIKKIIETSLKEAIGQEDLPTASIVVRTDRGLLIKLSIPYEQRGYFFLERHHNGFKIYAGNLDYGKFRSNMVLGFTYDSFDGDEFYTVEEAVNEFGYRLVR